jgi:MtN3 and saliva related transmembrane protein
VRRTWIDFRGEMDWLTLEGAGGGAIVSIPDVIGWVSTAVLLATICRQVYSQWKSKATAGVSRWLFVGQISASIGFAWYSYQLHNWIFLFSNSAMLVTAVAGETIFVSNRRRLQKTACSAGRTG